MEFQIGDIVQLKSGGIIMTVTDVDDVNIKVIYWNPVSAKFDRVSFETGVLIKTA